MNKTSVYIFSGKFDSVQEACLYSQSQWEPEPDDSVSDKEYAEWEDRNPIHKLKENINSYLDEDFIETIDIDFHYLENIHLQESDVENVKALSKEANIFILVYEQALGGFELKKKPVSSKELVYCGQYDCVL